MLFPSRSAAFLLALFAALRSAPAQDGKVAWFSGARHPLDAIDPRAGLALSDLRVAAGDVLEHACLTPSAFVARAGVEAVFDDGSRSPAALVEHAGAWSRVRVPLDRWAGRKIERFELSAHGFNSGPIAFAVDDVSIVRAGGSRVEIFADALGAGAFDGALAMVVAASSAPHVDRAILDAPIADPWAALVLDPTILPVDVVGGVPRRRGEFVEMHARRVGLAPIEGGRAYELFLFVENTSDADVSIALRAFGPRNERRAVEVRVPARGSAPPVGLGFVVEDATCLVVPIATDFALSGIELPDEPRVRVQAISAHWRRAGVAHPEFRTAWIQREAEARLDESLRREIGLWSIDRRLARIFRVPLPDARERQAFDALYAGDVASFSNGITAVRDATKISASHLRATRVSLAWSAVEPSAVRAALALLAKSDDACAFGGVPFELDSRTENERERIAAFAAGGRWTTFDWPYSRDQASTASLEGWIESSGRAHARFANTNAAGARAWLDTNLGERFDLATPLVRAGVASAFAFARDALPRESFALWRAGADAPIATLRVLPPSSSAAGVDTLPWGTWSDLLRSKRGAREPFVALDAASPRSEQDRIFVSWLTASEIGPRVRWIPPDRALEQLRASYAAGAQAVPPSSSTPLDERGIDSAQIARAVRAAESALFVEDSVMALAALDGLVIDADAQELARERIATSNDTKQALELAREAQARTQRGLEVLARASDTRGPGVPLLAVNPLPFARREVFELASGSIALVDARGRALPSQSNSNGGLVFALDVPPLGVCAVHVVDEQREPLAAARESVEVSESRLASARVQVDFDAVTSSITHVRFDGAGDVLAAPLRAEWVDGAHVEALAPAGPIEIRERGPLRAVAVLAMRGEHASVELEFGLDAFEARVRLSATSTASSGRTRLVVPVAGGASATFATASGEASAADDALARHPASSWIARGSLAISTRDVDTFSTPAEGLAIDLDASRRVHFDLVPRSDGLERAVLRTERPVVLFATDAHDGAHELPYTTLELDGPGALRVTAVRSSRGGRSWRVFLAERGGRAASLRVAGTIPIFGARVLDAFEEVRGELEIEDRRRLEFELPARTILGLELDLTP